MQSNPKRDVKNAIVFVGELINLINRYFPCLDGNGWNIPKIHSLAKIVYYMLEFGLTRGTSGQTGEQALKEIVKDHGRNTQHHVAIYTEQVSTWRYEN